MVLLLFRNRRRVLALSPDKAEPHRILIPPPGRSRRRLVLRPPVSAPTAAQAAKLQLPAMLRFGAMLAVACVRRGPGRAEEQLALGTCRFWAAAAWSTLRSRRRAQSLRRARCSRGRIGSSWTFRGQRRAPISGHGHNHGSVKAVRSGLFARNPPVTRVVLDLTSPKRTRFFRLATPVG